MSTSVERCNLEIHTVIKITGISSLSLDAPNKIRTKIGGGWTVTCKIPASGESAFGIYFFGPPYFTEFYSNITTVQCHCAVLSLAGDHVLTEHTGPWLDMTSESVTRGAQWVRHSSWDDIWRNKPTTQKDDGFCLSVNITSAMERPEVYDYRILRHLGSMTRGHDLIDTQFLAFSHHLDGKERSGARDPLPVYASSALIKDQCHFFRTILGNHEFLEATVARFDQPPSDPFIEEYDYQSDSDLSYFSEDEVDDEDPKLSNFPGFEDVKSPGAITVEDTDVAPEPDTRGDGDHTAIPATTVQINSGLGYARTGKIIAVKDTAYVTWRALIFYLCTSQLMFAPLTSRGVPKLRARSAAQRFLGFPSKPSAKSMYRLADKLGLDELGKLALEHIRGQLTTDNICRELFSTFTSRYDAVLRIELEFASRHWDEIKGSTEIADAISEAACGTRTYVSSVLDALRQLLGHIDGYSPQFGQE